MTKIGFAIQDSPSKGIASFNPALGGAHSHSYDSLKSLELLIEAQMIALDLHEVEEDMIEFEGESLLAFFGEDCDPIVEIPQ